jgi:hypothetical protein
MATSPDPAAREQDERTPLLPNDPPPQRKWGKSVLYRALACGFMVSLSFSVTQVP